MQLDWKVRNEKLEEELLFIKQQLLIQKMPDLSPECSPVQEYAQRLGMIRWECSHLQVFFVFFFLNSCNDS